MNRNQETLRYKRADARNFAVMTALFVSVLFLPSTMVAQSTTVMSNTHGSSKDLPKDNIIHQEISFKASPQQLYDILLSSQRFSESTKKSFNNFTTTSANIDPVVGGAFSVFDGVIFGRILELIPNQRIVEAWRVADWPAGAYSIVRFELKPQGSGTLLVFDHIGFPDGLKEHLAIGWQEHYWGALAKYLQ